MFETKKVKLETLGEYLSEIRGQLGFTCEDVAKRAGIKIQHLTALEEGLFGKLPPDVYVYGFLKTLAELYLVESRVLIDQYKKEKLIQDRLSGHLSGGGQKVKKYFQRIVVTPKLLSLFGAGTFVLITLGYIVWQLSSINQAPRLEILQPQDRQIITQSSVIVEGKTDPGMTVSLNDQNVFVDSFGNFKTHVGIGSGTKELSFTARNKFDNTVTKTITVVGGPQGGEVAGAAVEAPLVLVLRFTDAVTLTYSLDGTPEEIGQFESGGEKTLTARQKIVLSASNAGATLVEMNDKPLGPLGRLNEELVNVPFFVESGNLE